MKFTNSLTYSLVAFSFTLLMGTSCNNRNNGGSGIQVDPKKVQEHIIPIQQAIEYTTRFRENRTRLDSFFSIMSGVQTERQPPDTKNLAAIKNPLTLKNAEYFNRDAIAALLNHAGPDGGIRIYLGQDEKGVVKLVLIPVKNNEDIITRLVAKKAMNIPGVKSADAAPYQEGDAIEKGQECPEMCPTGSPLYK